MAGRRPAPLPDWPHPPTPRPPSATPTTSAGHIRPHVPTPRPPAGTPTTSPGYILATHAPVRGPPAATPTNSSPRTQPRMPTPRPPWEAPAHRRPAATILATAGGRKLRCSWPRHEAWTMWRLWRRAAESSAGPQSRSSAKMRQRRLTANWRSQLSRTCAKSCAISYDPGRARPRRAALEHLPERLRGRHRHSCRGSPGTPEDAPVVAGASTDAKAAVHRFVRLCVEVLNGYRPAAHLRGFSCRRRGGRHCRTGACRGAAGGQPTQGGSGSGPQTAAPAPAGRRDPATPLRAAARRGRGRRRPGDRRPHLGAGPTAGTAPRNLGRDRSSPDLSPRLPDQEKTPGALAEQ